MPDNPLRRLLDDSPVQIWTARPDGSLDYVNAAVTRFFGRTAEEMLGEGWLNYLHPADIAPTVDRWTRSILTGNPYATEFRLRRASDRQYYWHLAQAEARRDPEGKIVGWFGANTDINGLKRTVEVADARQELVRRERDRLVRAFNRLPSAAVIYSGPDFVLETVNAKWEEVLGRRGAAGMKLLVAYPELADSELWAALQGVYATGDAYHHSQLRLRLDRDGAGVREDSQWSVSLQLLSDPAEPTREILGLWAKAGIVVTDS